MELDDCDVPPWIAHCRGKVQQVHVSVCVCVGGGGGRGLCFRGYFFIMFWEILWYITVLLYAKCVGCFAYQCVSSQNFAITACRLTKIAEFLKKKLFLSLWEVFSKVREDWAHEERIVKPPLLLQFFSNKTKFYRFNVTVYTSVNPHARIFN